jgi:hypothetical protein
MLATRVRPSILIPTLEIFWSVLTFCTSLITSVPHLYAIRFLVGLCESGYFPVMIVSPYLQSVATLGSGADSLVPHKLLVHQERTRQTYFIVLLHCSPCGYVQWLPASRSIQRPRRSAREAWMAMAIHRLWCQLSPLSELPVRHILTSYIRIRSSRCPSHFSDTSSYRIFQRRLARYTLPRRKRLDNVSA